MLKKLPATKNKAASTFPPEWIKTFLAHVSPKPGVYQMLDDNGRILYVGKAKNLKKRLSSYFNQSAQNTPKTKALIAQIADITVTITHTEGEALILENTLIKKHQPRYNILLRDDKSYPYIYLSAHQFPRLSFHRGVRKGQGKFFGPYPHAKAVHDSLNLLQKLFPIRQCHDSYFRHRSRPCLQYQIQRCSAPCVGLIDEQSYQEDVQHAVLFLEGKNQEVINQLIMKMETAAQALEFEKAAKFRDQIQTLRAIQERQYVTTEKGNIDVIVGVLENHLACVQVINIRGGQHIGNQAYFPKHTQDSDLCAILSAFIPQFYLNQQHEIPDEIITHQPITEIDLLTEVLTEQRKKTVHIHTHPRSTRARWVEMALENARASLAQQKPNQYQERLAALAVAFKLAVMPQRIECFDVSHTQGEATVAACVVFDQAGPAYSAYRRFNINNIQPGDDYAAMNQVLRRRYQHFSQEKLDNFPDLIFIDGGKAQVNVAKTVFSELNLLEKVQIVGIAKGVSRKPGLETLVFSEDMQEQRLPSDSPALHFIQQIRDEAHRFALVGHQGRRAKVRTESVLEQIDGVGAKRRQQLIKHFGGLQGITRAGVEDLVHVPGISRALAQKIYDFFH